MFKYATVKGCEVEITLHDDGYKTAVCQGTHLTVRADGSHSYANVNESSEMYQVLNEAIAQASRA